MATSAIEFDIQYHLTHNLWRKFLIVYKGVPYDLTTSDNEARFNIENLFAFLRKIAEQNFPCEFMWEQGGDGKKFVATRGPSPDVFQFKLRSHIPSESGKYDENLIDDLFSRQEFVFAFYKSVAQFAYAPGVEFYELIAPDWRGHIKKVIADPPTRMTGHPQKTHQRRAIQSRNIKYVEYYPASKVLEVAFRNGSVYEYYDVSEDTFVSLTNASSAGAYFAQNIKDVYEYSRIE